MRFWADRPDIVIPVQWYFSDGQPYVPNAGPFRSRLYQKEDEVNWADGPMFPGELGEDYASNRIRNVGNRPAWLENVPPPAAGRFCGSPRAWRGEGIFALDPPLLPSPDGTSLCCGYENAPFVGTVGGGGDPSGDQGGSQTFVGAIGAGGGPEAFQFCGGTQLIGGPDCSSAVVATLGMPIESDTAGTDEWYVFPTPPAGTYTYRQFCDQNVGVTVYTGTCSDLVEQLTLCPGAAGTVYSVLFTLDGSTDVYIFANTELSDPGDHAVWGVYAGGCPGAGPTQIGSAAGGGGPSSIQSGSSGPLLDGQAGGGGGPAAVLTPGGSVTDTGAAAGGGGPEAIQTGM